MRAHRRQELLREAAPCLLAVGLAGVAGFSWFVVISWDVLCDALGLAGLLAVLAVVALTVATWAAFLVRSLRPGWSPTRTARTVLVAVSVLAAATGILTVPATRDQLESDKCRRVAEADAGSQTRCRDSLETRRQWWTLGLSHRDGGDR